MSYPNTFVQRNKVVQALAPATDAAGRNGAWVNAGLAAEVIAKAHITQGNAATIALTLEQAQDAAGTGAKAITATVPIWANLDTAATDTFVRQTDAASFTTDAAVKNKQVVFAIDPSLVLDIANGFRYVRIKTGASNGANLTQGEYVLRGLRYQEATPPSAIT